MNKFRANLHPAFFNHENLGKSQDWQNETTNKTVKSMEKQKKRIAEQLEAEEAVNKQAELEKARIEEQNLKSSIRMNNEALGSAVVETKEEKEQTDEEVAKQLEKQLKQLAKNKKIDFPWTDNAWKCTRAEKRLAISTAKVVLELLGWNPKLTYMIDKCKSKNWELTKQEAETWKTSLGINSKTKDIQNFYKAFKEYQDPQSQFQHLKNLMWFFCESGFEQTKDLVSTMKVRSEKLSKQDINNAWKMLYQEWWETDEDGNERYVIRDNKTGEEIKHKPKDWKEHAKFEVIKNRLNEGETSSTEKMLTLLWDFNLDGEVNSGDVGYKTWTQLADVFRRTVATKQLEDAKFDDNVAVKNIVAYANKFSMDIKAQSVDELYQWMTDDKEWYKNTRKLQDFIKNLSIEIDDVIVNWADVWKASLNRMMRAIDIEKDEAEKAREAATDKTKEILEANDQKLKDLIEDATERANLMQQLTQQLPWILVDHANNVKEWVWVGARLPLDQIIKWLSAWLHVGVDSDWNPKFGLFVGLGTKLNLSKSTDLSAAVNAGNNLLFIPCGSASLELWRDINKKSREESLAAKWVAKVTLGGNISITGWIFSRWVSAGFENNKKAWIEKHAKDINNVVKKQAKSRVETLKTNPDGLKDALKKEWPEATEDDLNKATDSLSSIIRQLKIDEQTTEADFDIYAKIIADVYTEQWRNASISRMTDNKRKITWWKLWVQFFAGFVPLGTAVLKFTKYYNARTNETEHARTTRIDEQVNGTSNRLVALEWKEIWESQIAQINKILERYGAKNKLEYVAWKGDKPWRIVVPAAIAYGVWINVRVSENLKWCVIDELNNTYSFPANATYRLLQETGWNQRSLTLNIGSDKNASSDVMISDKEKMNEMTGNKELMWGTKLEYKPFENKWRLDYNPEFINDLFTDDVVEWLKTIDSSNRRKFSEFMRTKKDAMDDFDKMINAVINILWKDKKYEAIKNKLLDKNTPAEDKQLIIDRIMAISADANVHNEAWFKENLKLRKDYYKKETMKGPNWKSIFDKLSINRDEFINTLNGDYTSEPMPNVLWATAFYNKNNTAKWLALTWLGATNVLWWKTKMLTGDDKKAAEEWFLGVDDNLGNWVSWALSEKSPKEWSNLAKVIEDKLPKGAVLSYWALKHLLKWEEVELSLDNSQKKVKVKLDVKYVFYLMWECANESVGMELWDLQVQEQHEVPDYKDWKLFLNDSEGASTVDNQKNTFAAGVSTKLRKDNKKDEEEPEWKVWSDNYNDGLHNPWTPWSVAGQTGQEAWGDDSGDYWDDSDNYGGYGEDTGDTDGEVPPSDDDVDF